MPVDDLDVPNCVDDLTPMEPDGEGDRTRWVCPDCGFIRIA